MHRPGLGPAPAVAVVMVAMAVAALLALAPAGLAQPHEDQKVILHIVAKDEGCPDGRAFCLFLAEGNPADLAPGTSVEIRFANQADGPHTLHATRLAKADPLRDTDPADHLATTGPHGIEHGETTHLAFQVPEGAGGLYLWCDIADHERRGMVWIVTFGPANAASDGGPFEGSSAWVLGASLLATIGAIAVWFRDKLKLGLLALYTRLTKREVVEHGNRGRILEHVAEQPGIHFRALARELEMGHGILDHHLRKLVEAGLLEVQRTESHRCYFRTGELGTPAREALAKVKAGGAQRVMVAVAQRPGMSLSRVADEIGLAVSTVSHHVGRLTDAGVIEARREGPRKALHLTPLGQDVLAMIDPDPPRP